MAELPSMVLKQIYQEVAREHNMRTPTYGKKNDISPIFGDPGEPFYSDQSVVLQTRNFFVNTDAQSHTSFKMKSVMTEGSNEDAFEPLIGLQTRNNFDLTNNQNFESEKEKPTSNGHLAHKSEPELLLSVLSNEPLNLGPTETSPKSKKNPESPKEKNQEGNSPRRSKNNSSNTATIKSNKDKSDNKAFNRANTLQSKKSQFYYSSHSHLADKDYSLKTEPDDLNKLNDKNQNEKHSATQEFKFLNYVPKNNESFEKDEQNLFIKDNRNNVNLQQNNLDDDDDIENFKAIEKECFANEKRSDFMTGITISIPGHRSGAKSNELSNEKREDLSTKINKDVINNRPSSSNANKQFLIPNNSNKTKDLKLPKESIKQKTCSPVEVSPEMKRKSTIQTTPKVSSPSTLNNNKEVKQNQNQKASPKEDHSKSPRSTKVAQAIQIKRTNQLATNVEQKVPSRSSEKKIAPNKQKSPSPNAQKQLRIQTKNEKYSYTNKHRKSPTENLSSLLEKNAISHSPILRKDPSNNGLDRTSEDKFLESLFEDANKSHEVMGKENQGSQKQESYKELDPVFLEPFLTKIEPIENNHAPSHVYLKIIDKMLEGPDDSHYIPYKSTPRLTKSAQPNKSPLEGRENVHGEGNPNVKLSSKHEKILSSIPLEKDIKDGENFWFSLHSDTPKNYAKCSTQDSKKPKAPGYADLKKKSNKSINIQKESSKNMSKEIPEPRVKSPAPATASAKIEANSGLKHPLKNLLSQIGADSKPRNNYIPTGNSILNNKNFAEDVGSWESRFASSLYKKLANKTHMDHSPENTTNNPLSPKNQSIYSRRLPGNQSNTIASARLNNIQVIDKSNNVGESPFLTEGFSPKSIYSSRLSRQDQDSKLKEEPSNQKPSQNIMNNSKDPNRKPYFQSLVGSLQQKKEMTNLSNQNYKINQGV